MRLDRSGGEGAGSHEFADRREVAVEAMILAPERHALADARVQGLELRAGVQRAHHVDRMRGGEELDREHRGCALADRQQLLAGPGRHAHVIFP